jgi:hypothetical protein
MSEMDENKIYERLERLSHVEPTQEAIDRARQRVRDALTEKQEKEHSASPRIIKSIFKGSLPKLAAAAVLLIGAGFLAGRLSTPKPLDVQALRADLESSLRSSLETTIRQELVDEMENRLQSALAADRESFKQELRQQVGRDMQGYAEQTLTTVGNLMDQRFIEFARLVEAARIRERQRVAAAFDYMGSRFGDGLVTLAAQTNESQRPGQN